jgi:lipopolysaccharide biosynthesis glycosyltransferase
MAPRYAACSNKIHAWRLTAYDAVCWLDSDIVITQPIDDLFKTAFHAQGIAGARGCRCNIFRNPKLPTLPHECPFNNKQIPPYINAGVVLLHPSVSTYRRLRRINYDHPFAEQDAFNLFFKDKITVLDTAFDYMNHMAIAHPKVLRSPIKIYHFGYGKPWEDGVMTNAYYSLWKKYNINTTHINKHEP